MFFSLGTSAGVGLIGKWCDCNQKMKYIEKSSVYSVLYEEIAYLDSWRREGDATTLHRHV